MSDDTGRGKGAKCRLVIICAHHCPHLDESPSVQRVWRHGHLQTYEELLPEQ